MARQPRSWLWNVRHLLGKYQRKLSSPLSRDRLSRPGRLKSDDYFQGKPFKNAVAASLTGRWGVNCGDDHMTLKLVASNDDRALAIRDHLLPLVRQHGRLEVQRGCVRRITLEQPPWIIHHWTPFNDLQAEEASSPGYRHALERQHAGLDLPYGLEVWHNAKVLDILWADDGRIEIACFIRGPWEDAALAL